MEPNIPLFRKTLEHIEANPSEWQQSIWGVQSSCGTSFCFAGTALHLNGNELDWVETLNGNLRTGNLSLNGARINNILDSPSRAARYELGISEYSADILFDATNSLTDIKDIVFHITNGEVGECCKASNLLSCYDYALTSLHWRA